MSDGIRLHAYEDINFEEIDEDLAAFQEDEMVQHALQRGVDLKRYGTELEKDLRKAEAESVSQYVDHNEKFLVLHQDINECDQILGRMEEMLRGFQADLGEISSEIKHLQDDSLFMNVKLKNRRNVEEKLNKFLEKTAVSPHLTQHIMSPNINDAFLDSVIILADRLKYLEQQSPPYDGSSLTLAPSETCAARILLPELEKLKVKAISKSKDYFINQISLIRKSKTNIQMLQQNALLKYAALFHFLQSEAFPVADEIRSMYVESMSKTLTSLFKSYYTQLMKCEIVLGTKNDLIVAEEAALKSLFSSKLDLAKKHDSFALSGRDNVLEEIESQPLLIHVVTAENQKVPYEVILRSVLKHLVDAASNEFLFIIEFFKTNPKDTFNRIFGKTISLLLENFENYLLGCFDAIGILLMIRLSFQLRLVMQRRRIPVLDPLFDRLSLLLWPRFKQVLDANIKSMKAATSKKLAPIDCTPHLVIRRYADFISAVIQLSATSSGMGNSSHQAGKFSGESLGVGGGGESMIHQDIQILRSEVIALLERMAETFQSPKEKKVFLINNYDLIISIFQEKQIISEEVTKYDELLLQQREFFAEEEIRAFFPRLIQFVVQCERGFQDAPSYGEGRISIDESTIESLVKEFAMNWKSGIQQINDDVLAYFANYRNGMEILKQVLTQLLLYYTRFQDIIKKTFSRPPPFSRDIVSTATILMEIKRYSRTF